MFLVLCDDAWCEVLDVEWSESILLNLKVEISEPKKTIVLNTIDSYQNNTVSDRFSIKVKLRKSVCLVM